VAKSLSEIIRVIMFGILILKSNTSEKTAENSEAAKIKKLFPKNS
jgi:hypothetical protein